MFLLGNTLGDLNGEERGPHVGKNFVRKVVGRIFSLQQTPSTGIIFGRTNIFNTFFLYLTTYIFITSNRSTTSRVFSYSYMCSDF